ncbi:hypothetical protein LPJ57_000805 [Coemansia sp. RSA 486]|nr:hypothetical protein LPJ57_000805 [Coemansia sp. RSA 486]KAJ2235905.1 hypothetical protein IWW45_002216 [Coemansia sp. RSA 485]
MAETQHQSSNTESSTDEATHEQQDYTSQTKVAFNTTNKDTEDNSSPQEHLSTFSIPTVSTKSKPVLQIRTQPTLNLNINNSDEESVELMLARAEVANDILYRDPKRVVIEGGNVNADEGTLRSLMDVTSPTIAKPPNDSSWLDTPKAPVAVDSDAYPVYPEGDERALPEFILSSQTVAELDAVTGAWENALDQLPDGEFWRAVVDDCEGLKKRAPLHLAAKIRAGIPSRVRGVVWQTLTQARSTYLQTVYAQLVQEPSPHERVIRRDLPRTFPRIPVFKREGDEGQQRLFRILKAYSLYDAEVGYCQGLGFIIGPLIMSMDECQAFCVLVRLMETYDLRGMFTEDMAGLHLRLYQFAMLAQEIVPEVMTHLVEHGVLPAMYAPAWFLSLFAYTMPLSFVLRALDVIVAEGAPESIMRVGIALLQRNAQEILRQEDFESAMLVLNTGLYDDTRRARDRPGFVLQDAAKLSAVVTSERLVELENQYYREQGSSARAAVPRPSMSSPSPSPLPTLAQPSLSSSAQSASSTVAANHAVMKFLGWRWGRDQKPMRDDESGSASGGHLSPRILELTDAQRARSQRLREQMLKTLQSQQNAPTTILGTVASLTPQAEGISPSSSVSSMTASPDDAPPRMSMSMSMRNNESSSDSAWRDDVLEPLQRQLHDARVTCDSHRDALVALQADHEALRAELAMAKAEKAHLAEENEQLRNSLRKMEAESNKVRQEAEYGLERSQRSEEALIQARMELAEADEEKSLLVRQLSNLRRFIASEGNAAANASGAAGALPPSRLSKDDSCASDGVVPRARVLSMDGYLQEDASIASRISGVSAPSSSQKQTSRFSISSIASNWSAIRDAITSPRQSMHSEAVAAGTTASSSSLSSSGGPQLVVSVQQKGGVPMAAGSASASPLSPALSVGGGSRPSSIPLAMLHRSKTIGSTSTTTTATMSGSKSPPIA